LLPRSKARDKGSGARGSRRYVRQIQRSVSSHEWQQLVGIHALRGLLDCRDRCCQFRPVETRDKSGREHSLYARVNEARELDALPPSMRAQRQLDVLSSARSTLTACNHALAQAGREPFATEHIENQVTALERLIARRRAA
jgi:hypothetical protein